MAGGEPDDILRSLRRYVSLALGTPPWTVRIQRTRVEDDQRPVCIIEESSPLQYSFARATIPQGDVQLAQSYAVVAYPALSSNPADSRGVAAGVRDLLLAAFSRGLVTDAVPPVNIGGPFGIPVYDFAGVPLTGADRAGPEERYMTAAIDRALNARAIQDPLDELRFSVVCNLRASWWAAGRVRPPAPIVTSMPGTPQVQ